MSQDETSFTLDATTGMTAAATDDGRINVDIDSKLARAFNKLLRVPEEQAHHDADFSKDYTSLPSWSIPMNIVIQVVGTRGDVQPFVALGNELQKSGHRVRIATHATFKDFVKQSNLDFFPIGGDPADLMAFMVQNPGLIPSIKTIQAGEISKKRRMIAEMLTGCWKACLEPDEDGVPFVANAIIANPVSFAGIHCAQALSIPLHMVFTMPWSPTRAFAHPLANLKNNNTEAKIANYISYSVVQALTWQGLADVINKFRKSLDLQDLPTSEAPFILETLRVPYTYCWSTSLVPKPRDWPEYIDVSGFIFRSPPTYNPPETIQNFLDIRSAPIVYIGFGSIVVADAEALLQIILSAVARAGVRAIISRGWSGMKASASRDVLFIDDCPHEWLFKHVSAVVHHGGAGTTACGLLNSRPTAVVPFFGDQLFWGERIAAAGAGPQPIPYKHLNASNFEEAIRFCLTPQAAVAAARIANVMTMENGTEASAASFHRHLSVEELRCDIVSDRPAVYEISMRPKNIKVCGAVARILLDSKMIRPRQLHLYKPCRYNTENQRWDPVTSLASVTAGQAVDLATGVNNLWYAPYKIRQAARKQEREPASSGNGTSEQTTIQVASAAAVEPPSVVGPMIGASVLSLPKMFGTLLKGVLLDTPFAVTEGLRNMPRLYGENVAPRKVINGFKAGSVVGGKEFVSGITGAMTDLYEQPYQGAKQSGSKGLAIGLAKGSVGTVTKLGAATLGLWSYPMQGLWMTIYNAAHSTTSKAIHEARYSHDDYFATRDWVDEQHVLNAFRQLTSNH